MSANKLLHFSSLDLTERDRKDGKMFAFALPHTLFYEHNDARHLKVNNIDITGKLRCRIEYGYIIVKMKDGTIKSYLTNSNKIWKNAKDLANHLQSSVNKLVRFEVKETKNKRTFDIKPGENVHSFQFSPSIASIFKLWRNKWYDKNIKNIVPNLYVTYHKLIILCNEVESNTYVNQAELGVLGILKLNVDTKGNVLECKLESTPQYCKLKGNTSSFSFEFRSLGCPEMSLSPLDAPEFSLSLGLQSV